MVSLFGRSAPVRRASRFGVEALAAQRPIKIGLLAVVPAWAARFANPRQRWSCSLLLLLAGCMNGPPPAAFGGAGGIGSPAASGGAGSTPVSGAGSTPVSGADAAVQDAGCGSGCGAPPAAGGPAPAEPVRDAGPTDDEPDAGDAPDAGASDLDAAADAATSDAGTSPNGRPPGVAECYSAASSGHAATLQHWRVLRAGDLAGRAAMIDALAAAAAAQPNEQEFALLLGLANLWRVAEPYQLESLDPLLTLDAIETAERELERAYRLCPTDHRIPAWLGPIKIRMGRILEDAAIVAEGFAILNRGIEHYPGFVLFSKLLAYAELPASDPDFRQAVDAVRDNAKYCGTVATGLASDPACRNHPRAAHNIEGSAVFLGDMYAKAQDRAAALAAYESAKAMPTWESWDYRELLEERIATLDARMAAERSDGTSDDLEQAWLSEQQCSLCHRD